MVFTLDLEGQCDIFFPVVNYMSVHVKTSTSHFLKLRYRTQTPKKINFQNFIKSSSVRDLVLLLLYV